MWGSVPEWAVPSWLRRSWEGGFSSLNSMACQDSSARRPRGRDRGRHGSHRVSERINPVCILTLLCPQDTHGQKAEPTQGPGQGLVAALALGCFWPFPGPQQYFSHSLRSSDKTNTDEASPVRKSRSSAPRFSVWKTFCKGGA